MRPRGQADAAGFRREEQNTVLNVKEGTTYSFHQGQIWMPKGKYQQMEVTKALQGACTYTNTGVKGARIDHVCPIHGPAKAG